eukprot:scaffold5052_cov131-Isochrysis_galbana.AAC.5
MLCDVCTPDICTADRPTQGPPAPGRRGGWYSADEAGGCGVGWRAKRGGGRVPCKGATLARTRTRSHAATSGLWTRLVHDRPRGSDSALSDGTPPVGPWRGVCMSACDIPGALRSRPSVRMESVSGSVMTSLTSGFLYEPPHDNPSSLAGEGFNSSSRKRAHFTSTKGSKARKAQERGEKEPHRHY